jgi:hypothetical protein
MVQDLRKSLGHAPPCQTPRLRSPGAVRAPVAGAALPADPGGHRHTTTDARREAAVRPHPGERTGRGARDRGRDLRSTRRRGLSPLARTGRNDRLARAAGRCPAGARRARHAEAGTRGGLGRRAATVPVGPARPGRVPTRSLGAIDGSCRQATERRRPRLPRLCRLARSSRGHRVVSRGLARRAVPRDAGGRHRRLPGRSQSDGSPAPAARRRGVVRRAGIFSGAPCSGNGIGPGAAHSLSTIRDWTWSLRRRRRPVPGSPS